MLARVDLDNHDAAGTRVSQQDEKIRMTSLTHADVDADADQSHTTGTTPDTTEEEAIGNRSTDGDETEPPISICSVPDAPSTTSRESTEPAGSPRGGHESMGVTRIIPTIC